MSVEDGSAHVIEAYGEALNAGDKATSKAMAAAYKYALRQTFCIPVAGAEDADASTHKLARSSHVPEPVQGWDQWVADILDMVRICETGEAIDRVQNSKRHLLKALGIEKSDLYASLGQALEARRTALAQRPAPASAKKRTSRSSPALQQKEVEHA